MDLIKRARSSNRVHHLASETHASVAVGVEVASRLVNRHEVPLSEVLLGLYTNAFNFYIFPKGQEDRHSVGNHEFVHAVLGTGTSTGLLHQTLGYLGFRSSSPRRQYWQEVYEHAVELARETHEVAAACASRCLCERCARDDSRAASLTDDDDPLCERLEMVIPAGFRVKTRKEVLLALARYAFDDPLEGIRTATWDAVPGVEEMTASILPRVDERFRNLLRLVAESDILEVMCQAASDMEDSYPDPVDGETMREQLGRRRSLVHERGRRLRELLIARCAENVPSYSMKSTAMVDVVMGALRVMHQGLTRCGETGLWDYALRIENDNSVGPDPLIFNVRVLLPNTPLTRLSRIRSQFFIPPGPTLAHLVQAPVDSQLSDDLTLNAGEWYSRFFYEIEGVDAVLVQTFYLISKGLPGGAWSQKCPVLVDGGVSSNELRQLAKPESPTGLWLPELTLAQFDEVLSEPQEWRRSLVTIDELGPDILFVAFSSTRDPLSLLALTDGAAAEVIAEESMTHLFPLGPDDVPAQRLLRAVLERFPYSFRQVGAESAAAAI